MRRMAAIVCAALVSPGAVFAAKTNDLSGGGGPKGVGKTSPGPAGGGEATAGDGHREAMHDVRYVVKDDRSFEYHRDHLDDATSGDCHMDGAHVHDDHIHLRGGVVVMRESGDPGKYPGMKGAEVVKGFYRGYGEIEAPAGGGGTDRRPLPGFRWDDVPASGPSGWHRRKADDDGAPSAGPDAGLAPPSDPGLLRLFDPSADGPRCGPPVAAALLGFEAPASIREGEILWIRILVEDTGTAAPLFDGVDARRSRDRIEILGIRVRRQIASGRQAAWDGSVLFPVRGLPAGTCTVSMALGKDRGSKAQRIEVLPAGSPAASEPPPPPAPAPAASVPPPAAE